jgi:hypothetical protein
VDDTYLVQQAQKAVDLVELRQPLAVLTAEDYAGAARMLVAARDALTRVEALEKSVTGPLYAAARAAHDLFAPSKAKIKESIESIEAPMVGYKLAEAEAIRKAKELEERAKRDAMERAHNALAEAEDATNPIDAMLAAEEAQAALAELREVEPAPQTAKADGTAARSYWRAEVFDATLVPREHCCPDLSKLNSIASTLKERAPEIPGVKWVQEFKISRRGR